MSHIQSPESNTSGNPCKAGKVKLKSMGMEGVRLQRRQADFSSPDNR